ncbi:MAG TPA: hypothetical protein VG165_17230 [Solirubrobacteraceae bacterium]|jgi:hypothetical protein|nr:hypothetical protein [Solirubrobacteraceae bacterium]
MSDSQIAPTEGRGGAVPSGSEIDEKGEAAEVAVDGIVPAELGGSDAPDALHQAPDPELTSDVLGGYASDPDVTATDGGVDLSGGDNADATANGGAAYVEGTPDASAVQTQPDPEAVS